MARILQLIDSLEAGGAERVAVNLANALSDKGHKVSLCSTRKGGVLKSDLGSSVTYFCLNKRSIWDLVAYYKLVRYVKKHQIELIHAHTSSIFTAVLIKIFIPKIRCLWHDHSGAYELQKRSAFLYRQVVKNLDGIISVNNVLKNWSINALQFPPEKVWLLPNFVVNKETVDLDYLPGLSGYRVICVANLRPQKGHNILIQAFRKVIKKEPKAHLILVGADTIKEIKEELFSYINDYDLTEHVTWLGMRNDVRNIMNSCDIGVISSISEGLPLVLLEYGTVGLPVIVTKVGECGFVVDNGNAGILIPPNSVEDLANAIIELIDNPSKREMYGKKLRERVLLKFSDTRIIEDLEKIYKDVLN